MGPTGTLGQAELGVLLYVEEHGPVAVRAVADHFATQAGLARTTILTVMERLRDKGFLARERADGVWVYRALVAKGVLTRKLVRDFVDRTLGGNPSPFFAYLADECDLSEAELGALRRLAAKLGARDQ